MSLLLTKISKNNKFRIFVFVFIFIFTFILRAHNYEKTPTSAHLDEQLYALSGLSLIETGAPVSWSTLDYPKSAEVFKGKISYNGGEPSASVTLFKPWLDEPPLFSLIVGEFAHIYHVPQQSFVPASYIRLPMVFISTLTSIVVFSIASLLGGFWIGIIAMLIYGTEPIMVFASRTAMPETLIALLFSVVVYLALRYQKSKKFGYLLPATVLAGIAGLSKPTGYFILGIPLYVLVSETFKEKKFDWRKLIKQVSFLILGTLPSLIFYIWYGNYYSLEIFRKIISIQGFRPAGFNSLLWFVITPSFGTDVFRSSWYLFSLLSGMFFVFTKQDDSKRILSMSFIYWILIVMFSSGQYDLLAWYRFPILPLLAVFGATGVKYIFDRADFFASFFGLGIFLGSKTLLANDFRPNIDPSLYRLSFTALLTPSLANTVFNKKWLLKFSRLIIVLAAFFGIWWNVKYVYNAYELTCESKVCPMVPTTFLSVVKFPFIWRIFILGKPTYP